MALAVPVDGGLELSLPARGAALLRERGAQQLLDLPVAADDGIGLDPVDHRVEALIGVLVHRQSRHQLGTAAGASDDD
ncbi:Uncharacterised protein [Mycobacteroides abscessus subsp. abscessus]|nr:Uncharacterised protein [Mycobacteroides abscessus subsp. abscessus]